MPIAKKRTFKCTKCKYEETLMKGDCLPAIKPCPKCGEMMQIKASAR